MKPDIPIIGQHSPSNRLLSTELFAAEFKRIEANAKAWETHRKIAELRKSCGVEDKTSVTVNVRRPPRYLGTVK